MAQVRTAPCAVASNVSGGCFNRVRILFGVYECTYVLRTQTVADRLRPAKLSRQRPRIYGSDEDRFDSPLFLVEPERNPSAVGLASTT